LVLACGAVLGCIVASAEGQRGAVTAIQAAGGTLKYDWEWRDNKAVVDGNLRWPTWLVDRLGVDYFGSVVFVDLYEAGSDELLVEVGRLNRLESLNLGSSHVTDAGLVHLERLHHLRSLSLIGTGISDPGLRHVKRLAGLNHLRIDHTKVTDAGLAHLEPLGALRFLGLAGLRVTDAGLAHLKHLTRLRGLTLTDTRVTATGLRGLQKALPAAKMLR
jgi:hypothetical protein